MPIYIVRTTAGKEKQVAERIYLNVKRTQEPIKAILHPEGIKGYIFIEADNRDAVIQAAYGIKNAKGVIQQEISIDKIEHLLTPAPKVINVHEGDIVELISTPFKSEKARVKRVNPAKEEVVVELLEAAVPIPMRVSIENIRVIKSVKEEEEENA